MELNSSIFLWFLKAKVDLWLQVSYPSSPHPAPPLTCLWMIWVPGLCLMLGTMMMVCPGSLSQLISSGGNSSATSMEVLLQTYSVLDQSQGGNITLNLKRLFKIRVSDHLPLNRKNREHRILTNDWRHVFSIMMFRSKFLFEHFNYSWHVDQAVLSVKCLFTRVIFLVSTRLDLRMRKMKCHGLMDTVTWQIKKIIVHQNVLTHWKELKVHLWDPFIKSSCQRDQAHVSQYYEITILIQFI